jgi:hypothetical protein
LAEAIGHLQPLPLLDAAMLSQEFEDLKIAARYRNTKRIRGAHANLRE